VSDSHEEHGSRRRGSDVAIGGHDSARLSILRLIQRKGEVTVKEMELELGRTTTAVREQLTALQADGYVTATRVKVKGELGRPYFVYSLTDKGQELFPKEYGDLTNLLLEEILALDGQDKLNLLLQRISARVAATYVASMNSGQHLLDRLNNLASLLSERGLIVEVQQQGNLMLMHAPSCPYFAVAQRHREICDMEQEMLGQALGSSVRLTSCVLDGNHGCDFVVGSPIEIKPKLTIPSQHD
jgi:predicted ArsR family transcriptional regulator